MARWAPGAVVREEKLWRPQCPNHGDLTASFIRKWEQELEDGANTGSG